MIKEITNSKSSGWFFLVIRIVTIKILVLIFFSVSVLDSFSISFFISLEASFKLPDFPLPNPLKISGILLAPKKDNNDKSNYYPFPSLPGIPIAKITFIVFKLICKYNKIIFLIIPFFQDSTLYYFSKFETVIELYHHY